MSLKSKLKMRKNVDTPRNPPRAIEGDYISSGKNDLFDNPMVRSAMAALSDEEKEKYKTIGEHLYGRINFEDGQSINNMPPSMSEAVEYMENMLLSGLHPSDMDNNDKELMKDAYGDEWYKKWGYTSNDLYSIT